MLSSPSSPVRSALLLLLLAGCAHPPPPVPSEIPPPPVVQVPAALRTALSGTWVYAGGQAELAQVDPAVEHATAEMGFLARGFAAEALRARARPRDRYTVALEGTTVTISSPEDPVERGDLGGPPVTVTDRFGDENQTTFELRDGALVEAGKSKDGSGETVFVPSADGRSLLVHRTMRSGKLSAPLELVYSYRRQD